jgi:hypothetical protein
MLEDYAGGRRLNPGERFVMSAAVRDAGVARVMQEYAGRRIGPVRFFARAVPRAMVAQARHAAGAATPEAAAPARATAA